ncbi:MAG: class I SAM-dependent methyltransferase [Verrucomicrobiaceae bacterium]|nr:MAG: class I SAM-dependent methyltransferase [Verrucomicrobiaceae bacterium]
MQCSGWTPGVTSEHPALIMLRLALQWTRRLLEPRWEMYPRGHYYSPLPDYQEVDARAAELFTREVDLGSSIQLNDEKQLELVRRIGAIGGEFDWSAESEKQGRRFYLPNTWFEAADSLALYGILRLYRPKRVIEVGSGFSSALMLDTNERFLDRSTHFTFIEPYPERLLSRLRPEDHAQVKIVQSPVQKVPLSTFEELGENDVLFIDSSHVSKIGSDVNFLLFEVLPRLRSGCLVHFHDIFWPFEYLQEWVKQGKAWNEAYILRAFLQYNNAFEILLFNSYMGHAHRPVLEEVLPRFLKNTGGSLWLRKV